MNASASTGAETIPREEFERLIHILTHEIRNRLNSIALEAADLAEQSGADAARLQEHVQSCSAFLKKLREMLAPDEGHAPVSLPDFLARLREEKSQ